MAKRYEITLVFPEKAQKDKEKIIEAVKKRGKVIKEESWGEKPLAYPIKKQTRGDYYFLILEAEAEKMKTLAGELNSEENLLRYLVVVSNEKSEVKANA